MALPMENCPARDNIAKVAVDAIQPLYSENGQPVVPMWQVQIGYEGWLEMPAGISAAMEKAWAHGSERSVITLAVMAQDEQDTQSFNFDTMRSGVGVGIRRSSLALPVGENGKWQYEESDGVWKYMEFTGHGMDYHLSNLYAFRESPRVYMYSTLSGSIYKVARRVQPGQPGTAVRRNDFIQTNLHTGNQRKLRYVPNGMTQSNSAAAIVAHPFDVKVVDLAFRMQVIPAEYMCPISTELMVDPVMLVGEGHTYERAKIMRWIDEKSKFGDIKVPAPTTNLPVEKALAPNHTLKSAIRQIMDKATAIYKRLADDDVKEELEKWHKNWRHCHSEEFAQLINLYVVSIMMGDATVNVHCGLQLEKEFNVKTIDPSARTVTFQDEKTTNTPSSSDNGDKKKRSRNAE